MFLSLRKKLLFPLDKPSGICYNRKAGVKAESMTAERQAAKMAKNLGFVLLLDCYGSLLTDKQRQLLEGYYDEDLSLSELAEPLGISRQAVHDSIRRGERQLEHFEEQLGLAARLSACRQVFEEIEEKSASLPAAEGAAIAEAARRGIRAAMS